MRKEFDPTEIKKNRAELLAEVYDGDIKALEADIAKSRSETINWQDLATASKIYPELETNVHDVIELLLGYLPPAHLTLSHEAFLRIIVQAHRRGEIPLEEAMRQAGVHLKSIRNAEMKQNGHHALLYSSADHDCYQTTPLNMLLRAQARITRFLSYSPQPEIALGAEMILSSAIMQYPHEFNEPLNCIDMQALTIIKFREVLFANGSAAAFNSPLVAKQIWMDAELSRMNKIS